MYYEIVRKFPHIKLKEPPLLANRNGFNESEALKLTFGLAGIVMAGVFKENYLRGRTISLSEGEMRGLHIEQFTFDRKDDKKNHNRSMPGNLSRETLEQQLNNFRKVLPCFIPKEEIEELDIKKHELTTLGLFALGILSVVRATSIYKADVTFVALTNIFRTDPLAGLLYIHYQEIFNGYKTVGDLLESINGRVPIKESSLREIYDLCNEGVIK